MAKNANNQKWWSWGSPIGMAIYFLALAIFIILINKYT